MAQMRGLVVVLLATGVGCGRIGFDDVDAAGPTMCTPPAGEPAATRSVFAGDDLFAALQSLGPGEVVEVHAGTYTSTGFVVMTWSGTQAQPIIVRAAPGERPIVRSDPTQNVFNLHGSYFTLRGFEITGGDDGVRLTNTSHVTLEDLRLHTLNNEGINCNITGMPCTATVYRRIEVYDLMLGIGTAIAMGCQDGSCSPAGATIEGCWFHDLTGMNGVGVAVAAGATGLVIRDNVMERTLGPGIYIGGSTPGTRNTIERNLVWATGFDNGIQIEGQVVVRNNIVLDAASYGIYSNRSAQSPDEATIVHNTVVGGTTGLGCLRTDNWSTATGNVVANNALYCANTLAIDFVGGAPTAVVAGNIGLGTSNAASGFVTTSGTIASDLGDPATAAVYPPASSALIGAGDPSHGVTDDYNGLPRDTNPDVGAYEHTTATNPGWPNADGFKPLPVTSCP